MLVHFFMYSAAYAQEGDQKVDFQIVETRPIPTKKGCKRKDLKNCIQDYFTKHIVKKVKYPKLEKEMGIEGTVYIQFVINKRAEITKSIIVKSSGNTALDVEAMRVFERVPDFYRPATQNDEAVSVQYTIPIIFKLK